MSERAHVASNSGVLRYDRKPLPRTSKPARLQGNSGTGTLLRALASRRVPCHRFGARRRTCCAGRFTTIDVAAAVCTAGDSATEMRAKTRSQRRRLRNLQRRKKASLQNPENRLRKE